MACLFSFFTRRKRQPSTPPRTEHWQTPSALYLNWLPQLPPSSSKPIGINYPTVRDIPSWLLLSPVDIPSVAPANESNMGNQDLPPPSPPPLPYLRTRCWPSQRHSSTIAADECVERIDEDVVRALSSPPLKDRSGRVSVIVLESDRTSTIFECSYQTKTWELFERDEARESRWTFGSIFAPLDAVARRSIRIHDSILFGLGNDDDSMMGTDGVTNGKKEGFEMASEGDELEVTEQQQLVMVNLVLASGNIARARRQRQGA